MPKLNLTLHDLIEKIKKPKVKADEVVPGVFAGSRFDKIQQCDTKLIPVVYPQDHPEAKSLSGSTYFYAAMGETPQQVAHRAMAYGMALAGRHYVPYALANVKDVDPQWTERLRSATGVSVLSEAGVDEIDNRDFYPLPAQDGVSKSSVYSIATNMMHAMGTPQESAMLTESRKLLKKRGYKKQAAMLKPMLYGAVEAAKSRTDLVEHLKALQEMFGTSTKSDPDGQGKPQGEGEGEGEDEDTGFFEVDGNDPGTLPDIVEDDTEPEWGKMENHPVPLDNRMVQSGKKSKVWKRAGVGAFRFPWRALKTSDLQCFAVKRKVYGGTLLFDISGSMHVTSDQIQTILQHSPEATMACYGGHTREAGRLVVMAKDGMAADPEVVRGKVGQYNIVDGPALKWLASQPEPRIWISDGHATGLDDSCTTGHTNEVKKIAQANRIVRIGSAQELVDLLKAKSS